MAIWTPTELVEVLEAGEFERLVGTPENPWLDFKGEPYRLGSVKDRWELVKDIATFANHQGGRLVIGVHTHRQSHEVVDIAVKVRPVPLASIDPQQYRDLVAEPIYPPLRGMGLARYQRVAETLAADGLWALPVLRLVTIRMLVLEG